ncbi:MAG: type II secretion system F family protein [Halofilum sp. (in: g-proteobacteria)]
MPRFEYSGRDSAGALVTGAIDARSLDAAVGMLFERGVTPLDVNERAEKGTRPGLRQLLGRDRPDRGEIILFTRQMYALTRSGIPLIQGLTQLAESSRNDTLVSALHQIIEDLESGRELAGALARHPRLFSPLYVSMVRVGEQSGQLEEAFMRMYRYLEREQETINQIKKATRYPSFVVLALVVAVWILMTWIIPVFARVFEQYDAALPVPTQILISISNFFSTWWLALALLAVGAVAALRAWLQTDDGRFKWDRAKLRLPGIGDILLRGTLARFARAFTMAHRAGVPVLETMNVVATAVDNDFVASRLRDVRSSVEHGEALSRAVSRTGIFTPLVVQMLAVGEETGRLDDMSEEIADFYEREVEYDVQNLTSLIEPVLTIGIAILVFLLAIGIFLPMWDLGSAALGGR